MDWFGVFSGLQCELDVVEALVADHVGIVVRVKNLHRQLHSVIEKACLKLGAIKLSRDVLHNKSVTSELGLLGSGELTAWINLEVAVVALGKHVRDEGLISSMEEPISREFCVIEVRLAYDSFRAHTFLEQVGEVNLVFG